MPLSSAERSRRWRERQKNDPEKHQEYLKKEKERYKKRKKEGSIRGIEDLTAREQRGKRRAWRKNQRNKRSKDKVILSTVQNLNTPPNSPTERAEEEQEQIQNTNTIRGRKKVRKDRAKAYREIKTMKVKLASVEKRAEKYKKRLQRMKNRSTPNVTDSPRTKTNQLLRGQNVTNEVRRTIVFHHTVVDSLKEKYRQSGKEKHRHLLANVMSAKLLRRYRLKKFACKKLNFYRCRKIEEEMEYKRKLQRNRRAEKLQEKLKAFLERDDNSRTTAGKKETVTRRKVKKQKRYLSDSLINLHAKYNCENPQNSLSYSFFCKLKPFWIVKPTEKGRETCLCIKCENMQYQIDKLKDLKILSTHDMNILASQICCSENNQKCMYRECETCKQLTVPLNEHDPGLQVTWKKWTTRRVERVRKDGVEEKLSLVSMTIRQEESGSVLSLLQDFHQSLSKICRHLFNIRHQYKTLRRLRESLKPNEAVIHMDFSENYNCKYDKEIQSVHFGASQVQVTLHTGVVYHGEDVLFSFCSMSDYNKHGPAAIWAHLKPVLNRVKQTIPETDTVHFISDGPTTQYRCKQNFYLFCTLYLDSGFKSGSWNFLEAGHGKGPADGIGGAIKRAADSFVANGGSITDAKSMYSALQKLNVELYLVDETDVIDVETLIPDELPAIQGTMKLHQVQTSRQKSLRVRILSCFCSEEPCSCYDVKEFAFEGALVNSADKSREISVENQDAFLDESKLGKWCVVRYDGLPYPGIIQNLDATDVEVKVMHRIGHNRFFWPMRDDVLWYGHNDVVSFIEQPAAVGSRHFQLLKSEWEHIAHYLNL